MVNKATLLHVETCPRPCTKHSVHFILAHELSLTMTERFQRKRPEKHRTKEMHSKSPSTWRETLRARERERERDREREREREVSTLNTVTPVRWAMSGL